MRRDQLRRIVGVGVALATIGFSAGAFGVSYIYTGGPNNVNMGGNRCRARVAAQQVRLQYTQDGVRSVLGGQTVYCPSPRRSTAFYGDTTADSGQPPIDTSLKVSTVTVRATDNNTSSRVSCKPFAALMGGGVVFGTTRTLCDTAGGCVGFLIPPTAWTGANTISWTNPFPTQQSVNWGITCDISQGSMVNHYEVAVTPNT
jgi:hypothetical protein